MLIKHSSSFATQTEEKEEEEEEEALTGEVKASPHADTTILFVKGDGECESSHFYFFLISSCLCLLVFLLR